MRLIRSLDIAGHVVDPTRVHRLRWQLKCNRNPPNPTPDNKHPGETCVSPQVILIIRVHKLRFNT